MSPEVHARNLEICWRIQAVYKQMGIICKRHGVMRAPYSHLKQTPGADLFAISLDITALGFAVTALYCKKEELKKVIKYVSGRENI